MAIVERLRQIQPFVFCGNNGNLGDQLIAVSTRQLFRKYKLEFTEYVGQSLPEGVNLVYGGGGGLVPYWGALPRLQKLLLHPNISCCVILPHSIFGVDDLVRAFDERHTVFCREERSYRYCCQLNQQATFLMADDMAFSYELENYDPERMFEIPGKMVRLYCYMVAKFLKRDIRRTKRIQSRLRWNRGLRNAMLELAQQSCRNVHIDGTERKIAFFLRKDAESAHPEYAAISRGDLSLLWEGSCDDDELGRMLVAAFMEALNVPDIVVTDRLHIGVAAYLQNKEVYWLDNSYRKISGIYAYTLTSDEKVHIISHLNELPWQLELSNEEKPCTPPRKVSSFRKIINRLAEI